jgi:tRNA (mo5U34)-methyltransferase
LFELDVSRFVRDNNVSNSAMEEEIAKSELWFHRFDFSNGVSTPGRDPSAQKLIATALPDRLDGKSVLDIGACEGYYSFQCEARGASRVVAADQFLWNWPGSEVLPHFRYVKEVLGSNVEELNISVELTSPKTVGTFDITLFLGVLYHAPNMVQYLNRVRSVTKEMAVIETLVDLLDVPSPAAAFYGPNEVNNDSSNWWGPNIGCVTGMLERAGFTRSEFKGLWEENTLHMQRGEPADGPLRSGRAVWHAFV